MIRQRMPALLAARMATRRLPAWRFGLLLVVAGALLGVACLGGGDDDPEVTVNGTPLTTATAAATDTPSTPEPTATIATVEPPLQTSNLDPDALEGFTMPIAGACLPSRDAVLPNALRVYRNGVHEGVDFYGGDVCVAITRGQDVIAMFEGIVIRADHDYTNITAQQVIALAAKTAEQGFTDPETLDIYHGRQVWIDHGNGIVTRYAHLEGVADTIDVGVRVQAGEVIAYIGESGTPESITDPGTEVHLHAEVRVGDSFLGAGLGPAEAREDYSQLFAQSGG